MNTLNVPRAARVLLSLVAGSSVLAATQTSARAAEGAEFITAVCSTAFKDYKRTKLPDGSFQTEYYSFGNGGRWNTPMTDETIDKLDFMDVARVISRPLAAENYLPARDPEKTRLVIMVYWGTTQVAENIRDSEALENYQAVRSAMAEDQPSPLPQQIAPQKDSWDALAAMNNPATGTDDQMDAFQNSLTLINMENERRTTIDYKNAQMLGYDNFDSAGSLVGTDRGKSLGRTALSATYSQEVAEIESPRYFVVLMAYDFQKMWKQKRHVLLWETRFSISQPHNDFTKALPAMATYASTYFGQNSHGLIREVLREGNVSVGQPTLVEMLNPSKK